MPGVADQIRKTQLRQDKVGRKKEMQELVQMVKEGRLHEADERQLETLQLALELNQFMKDQPENNPVSAVVDSQAIADAVGNALKEFINKLPQGGGFTSSTSEENKSRPGMKHTNLATLTYVKEDVNISHIEDMGETKDSSDNSSDKLEKLRRIKGGSS